MKRIAILPLAAIVLVACQDGTQPVAPDGVDLQFSGTYRPPEGLVSWWPGDGHTHDIVGVNHGTLQNGATFAPGMVGQAFSLDGVDDYVQTAASCGELATLTYDAWIRTTVSLAKIVSAGDADYNDGFATDLGIEEGRIEFYVNDYSTWTYPRVITDAAFNDGQWHHVAGVFNNTGGSVTDDLIIYVDGIKVPQSQGPFSGNPYNAHTRVSFSSLRIGRSDRVNVGKFFPGEVDEVEFFDRALSAEEILAIYEAGKAGKRKPPVCVLHKGNLIRIAAAALQVHLDHGDEQVVCPD